MSISAKILDRVAQDVSRLPGVSFLNDLQLSDGLLEGSIKSAAVIACSDMGWLVPYVCSATNVELFLFQNFGHHFARGGFVETVLERRVENVVVYGHTPCEFTKHLAKSAIGQLEKKSRLAESEERLQLYSAALESGSDTIWERVGQYEVLHQVTAILANPAIAPVVAEGKLKVHGWFYKSAEPQLEVFDPQYRAFIAQRGKLPDSLVVKFLPDQIQVQED